MTEARKKIESSYIKLSELLGNDVKRGWKQKLAKVFGVPASYLPKWAGRGNIPRECLLRIVKKGYPLEKWYLTAQPYEPVDERMLPQEDTRNPSSSPSYAVPPDHIAGYSPVKVLAPSETYLSKLVDRLKKLRISQNDVDLLVRALDRGGADVFRSVAHVLDSGESGTIMALKMNVVEFEQKIEEREELREMKSLLSRMKKRQDDLELLLDQGKKDPPGLREPVDPAANG